MSVSPRFELLRARDDRRDVGAPAPDAPWRPALAACSTSASAAIREPPA